MKVAIIGCSLAGLSCALELEKKGIIPEIYERDNNAGWPWAEIGYWPSIIYNKIGDPQKYLKEMYDIDIKPIIPCKKNIFKSEKHEIEIEGDLGYFVSRGKGDESVENQLLCRLRKTPVRYNTKVDYKELSREYDYVIVATGCDKEAREMGVWEDLGTVRVVQAVVLGDFTPDTAVMYLNTEYAGTGFGRLTPFSCTQAILSDYIVGMNEYPSEVLFDKFIDKENLHNLEIIYKFILPLHHGGRVSKVKIGNVILAGRAAGLTENFIGTGAIECMVSGVLAARSIADGIDYEEAVRPIQKHLDNICAFRKEIDRFSNKEFDKLLSFIGTPGVKQTLYNSGIDFADLFGGILKKFQSN